MASSPKHLDLRISQSPLFRAAIGVSGALLFLAAGLWSLKAGASRMLSDFGEDTANLTATEAAIGFAPGDPQGHASRAFLLSNVSAIGDETSLHESIRSYREALKLRPEDYALWNALGQELDKAGMSEEAFRAFTEATRLAPFYARPRWQLGNFLLRQPDGRDREAFDHLRLAARADPSLYPNLLDLAWGFYGGDVANIEAVVRPESYAERIALARFYVKRGRASDALRLYYLPGGGSNGGSVATTEQWALLADLLAVRQFAEAYQVWSRVEPQESGAEIAPPGQVNNGGFEREIRLNEQGFGWQVGGGAGAGDGAATAVSASLDGGERREGQKSLRIDFNGQSTPVLSQLVLMNSVRSHRLSFAARTKDLITGGLPVIIVRDASAQNEAVLAQSQTLPPGSREWQNFSVEFTPTPATRAVRITLERQNCASGPCPIFGHLWLDNFRLEKL